MKKKTVLQSGWDGLTILEVIESKQLREKKVVAKKVTIFLHACTTNGQNYDWSSVKMASNVLSKRLNYKPNKH